MSEDRPLRVLFVSRQFWPVAHGAENQMLRLAGALRRQGHGVQVLSARFDPAWEKREVLPGDAPLLRLASPRFRGLGTVFFLAVLAWYLVRHRRDYDVVHINILKYSGALAGFLCPRLGLPALARSICAGAEGDMAHLRTTPLPGLTLKGLRRLDRVIALSTELRGELLANGFRDGQVVLIPNAIDDERFRPPTAEERRAAREMLPIEARERLVAITTARLVKQKGLNYLIEAFREPGVRDRWSAVILGEGEERKGLEEMVAGAGLGKVVHFLGSVGDVRPWLHAADVFCLPSLYEGMSNSLLEAMACGLPALATRVSGTVDVVEDGRDGLLVEPGRPQELASGLRLLESAEKRRELGEAGRRRVVEVCGIEGIAERYVGLYREMIREKQQSSKFDVRSSKF